MTRNWLLAITAVLTMACPLWAAQTVLYDGTLGTLPGAQGWLYADPSTLATQVPSGSGVTFSTTASDVIQAGYTRFDNVLDAMAGYTLRFDMQINSEGHVSNDRAGFSVVVVSSDTSKALELGFWSDRIFAQTDTPLFTHGEETSGHNPSAGVIRYDLTVAGSTYELLANSSSILTGPMRDYTPFAGFPDPYEISNLIFLGDDTTSANASIHLTYVSIIPEPATLALLAVGATALRRRRRLVDSLTR